MSARAVGVTLLVCACTLAGLSAERMRRAALRELESWLVALEVLASELGYRAPTLPVLLSAAAARAGGSAGALLRMLSEQPHWEQVCPRLPSLLPQEELRPVCDCLRTLGSYPVRDQLAAIGEARTALQHAADALRAELHTRARVSRAAGLSFGLMLGFLLW